MKKYQIYVTMEVFIDKTYIITAATRAQAEKQAKENIKKLRIIDKKKEVETNLVQTIY